MPEKVNEQKKKKSSGGVVRKFCSYCKIPGHTREDCRKLQAKREKDSSQSDGSKSQQDTLRSQEFRRRPPVKCFNCKQEGHIAANCTGEPALLGEVVTPLVQDNWQCRGKVEGQPVEGIVLDTGCKRTMVHQRLISPENLLEGDVATIRCAHGDTVLYPLVNVRMEIDGIPIEVEAAVSDTLPVSVLLGRDVPQLKQLLSSSSSLDSPLPIRANNAMVVITRAQAKKQLEEEIVRREQEVLSGAKPKQVVDSQQESTWSSHQSTSAAREISATLTQDQRRALRKEIGSLQGQTTSISKALEDTLELSAEELQKLQEADMTLGKVRQAAECQDSEYFYHDGLLCRRWIPPGCGEEYGIEQLVLPKACRRAVLELGHEIPLAGYLGSDKTRQRILRRFYWPTVFKDIEEFCKCYLLFAHREVPQASTGFPPFKLLYGRNVLGPLDILKESWEARRKSSESVISYVLSTQEKLKGMAELV